MTREVVPRLLHFRVSHYNEKVRWALDRKRIAHRREALVPGFHIPRVRWLSGQNQVPVLQIGKQVIAGSNHILDELERRWPDPPLFPSEPAARARVYALQKYFDEEVAPEQRRLFWACYLKHPDLAAAVATDGFSALTRKAWRTAYPVLKLAMGPNMGLNRRGIEAAQRNLPRHFDRLEAEIGSSGYLVGDRFTAADLTAASIMTAIIRPPQFSYPLPSQWPPELEALRVSLSKRAGFKWVLDIYERERDPSSEVAA